ncbi:MAG: purine-nucleoside phosphorylase [Candidatus Eisenbacteria bacterium]|nr:purine-nucleoside phosphorylase [Candidatus Eisenbacteria bacterium]
MASELLTRINEARDFIRKMVSLKPTIGIILGTGLGELAAKIESAISIPYSEIPHFSVTSVESHVGELVFGKVSGKPVVVMNGRVHCYEGYTMREVTFPVRVMKALGAGTLVISNAVGGLNPQFEPGDIVIAIDHINLMGDNPLIGENDDELGVRFPDMSEPYTRALVKLAEEVALEEKIKVHKGVFVAVIGPNLETAAEYRFLRWIGADVVGMSLIPEDIVAVHGGMNVLALSIVTDMGLPDSLKPADISKILKVAAEAQPKLTRLVMRILEKM